MAHLFSVKTFHHQLPAPNYTTW